MKPLQGLRIGLLTASASRLGGGVFEAVIRQAALIRKLGGEPRVFALRDRHSGSDAARFEGVPVVHAQVLGPAHIGFAPSLVGDLMAADLDLLHLHGIWMYPSRAATVWARRTGRPYLISPHGMLDPATVRRRAWKKAIGRWLFELASWRVATSFHALTTVEAANIRAAAGPVATFVVPNSGPAPSAQLRTTGDPLVLFLGRIHAIKNLTALVEGWRRANLPQEARLIIAGWGNQTDVLRLETLVGMGDGSITFVGPAFGDTKAALFGRSRFLILPSLSEAMPMAVLEGWAAGVPAILTPQCNLPEGFAAGAALECGTTPDSIARALEAAFALDEAGWRAMADAAHGLAAGPFSAERVAARWATAYRDGGVA